MILHVISCDLFNNIFQILHQNYKIVRIIMAAASYYDAADTQEEKTPFSPSRGPQATGLGQELHEGGGERGIPQQGYNGQYAQQTTYGQNDGGYGGQQQMNSSNYGQGGGQNVNGAGGQAAVVDDRDMMTKCNDNLPDYMIRSFTTASASLLDLVVQTQKSSFLGPLAGY